VRQTILTCDASGWAGCAPGVYENELGKVEVLPDGRIVVAGQREILAGSGSATEACVARVAACGAATLPEAIDMASRNPLRFFGFPDGGLNPGARADLFLFLPDLTTGRLKVVATIVAGALRYGNIPLPEKS
jgi:N-acetylglucosamine-6-phosphate deacetylase